ncbi:F0F1 ATP synthase subunit A [Desulfobaculum bizertense]|uniref:ATP synthase subunit a n=1 Tax=Desulfobaculum bizertense DSM 18034 TaxID=1121442 RepID=A0A1T4WR91_9BACT|nr:F0F1 ATP synthase subunit A [Desulfobaculum bizertense]UIJ37283.1 F0F1 ATP synthase subunit A [Desulfobaculum bizertense]SKA79874.1 F-type H+-transporting ATPase subunit a [Desulfobaculum bizertense DSM 18034]
MAGGLSHPVLLVPDALKAVGINVPVHVSLTWTVMLFLFVLAFLVSRNLKMVPGKLQNIFELIIDGLENFVVVNAGEEARKVFPVLCTLFLFILPLNWAGLVPGFDAPTANINTNASMALFLFVYYNWIGIKKWKFGYIKHFMGPMLPLAPLMFIIEVVSHISRPLSLTLRLFGNIKGEEIVLLLMFTLAPIVSTLPMFFLFALAKFIQAFIFFMLGMIYLKGSLEPAH